MRHSLSLLQRECADRGLVVLTEERTIVTVTQGNDVLVCSADSDPELAIERARCSVLQVARTEQVP